MKGGRTAKEHTANRSQAIAAMEPAYERRRTAAAGHVRVADDGAAMEPAYERRENPGPPPSARLVQQGRNGARL